MQYKKIAIGIILAIVMVGYESIYSIKEGEQVILTRFGSIQKGPIVTPGYHLKFFHLDRIHRFPSSKVSIKFTSLPCVPSSLRAHGTIDLVIKDPIEFHKRIGTVSRIPAVIENTVRETFCDEKEPRSRATQASTISELITSELAAWGVAVVEIHNGQQKANAK